VKSVAERVGLEPLLARAYQRAIARGSGDTTTISVAGSTVEFVTETADETRAVNEHYLRSGELPVVEDILATLSVSDDVLDVGAHVGLYSVVVASQLESGSVYAFEPHPATVERLHENVARNGLDVNVRSVALGSTRGEANMTVGSESAGGQATLGPGLDGTAVTVESETYNHLVAAGELPECDVVKIDVEGAEMDVLKGMESALEAASIRALYVEVHTDKIESFGYEYEDVVDHLTVRGYDCSVISERTDDVFLKATRNSAVSR
jgi:FkbM family methyltransferase